MDLSCQLDLLHLYPGQTLNPYALNINTKPTCFFFAFDFFQLTPGGGCMSSRPLPTLLLACTPPAPEQGKHTKDVKVLLRATFVHPLLLIRMQPQLHNTRPDQQSYPSQRGDTSPAATMHASSSRCNNRLAAVHNSSHTHMLLHNATPQPSKHHPSPRYVHRPT
jgi:hypothetical protein